MSTESAAAGQPPRDEPSLKTWWTLVKSAVSSWIDDYAPSMGAALSYYTVFSLAPLLLIVVSIAGLVFGEDAVRGELFAQLQGLMGARRGQGGAGPARERRASRAKGVVGTIVGVALLVFGATTVFGELQDALDRIWRAPAREEGRLVVAAARAPALVRHDPRPRLPAHGLARPRRRDLGARQVVGAGCSAAGRRCCRSSICVVGFGLTTLVFAMIYKLMPRVHVQWHDVWLGAVVTAAAVHGRQVPDRPVHRQERHRLGVRRRRLAGDRLRLGLLLGADLPARRGVHLGVRHAPSDRCATREAPSRPRARRPRKRARHRRAAARPRRRRRAPAPGPERAPDPHQRADARARRPATMRDVGAGVALFVAMRFLLPRLLRRL